MTLTKIEGCSLEGRAKVGQKNRCTWAFEGSLRAHELLAYKLHLDAGIDPGKTYLVRPTNSDDYLFHGKPIKLLRIRPAEYCFRIKLEVPPEECTDPQDDKSRCLYTDNWQPAGLAVTPVEKKATALK